MGKFKGVVIFAGGAVVGSLATYYLVREKFRIQADEEIEQIRQLYLKKDADEMAEARKKEGIVEETEEDLRDYYIQQLRDLGYNISGDFADDEEDYEEVNPIEYPDTTEQVDESEFFNGFEDYESTSLTLYLKDRTCTDELEDTIPDLERWVGELDYDSLKPGELYFVNHPLMMKVELVVLNQSYKRDVLGEEDDEEGDYTPGDFADNN